MRVSSVNIGAPDARALAAFYVALLGYEIAVDEGDWVLLRDPSGGVALSCQSETGYVPPVWPAGPGDQQMMLHLEIEVEDLIDAVARAVEAGAVLAAHQPQADVRVLLDPAGHPFCLWVAT